MEQKPETIKIEKSVADFYETYGTAFGATRRAPWGVMELVTQAIASVPEGAVIDVGAGNARLAQTLPSSIRYVAIEPSSTLRALAEQRIAARGNGEVRAGGFPRLPAPDGEADVVACLAVLHHIPESLRRRAAVKELARITKPGGRAVVTVWNLRSPRFFRVTTWLAAWLRLPLVNGGEPGDVWIPWNANGADANRFVHAFSLREFRRLFDAAEWIVERAEAWGDGRNLVVVAQRKIPADS